MRIKLPALLWLSQLFAAMGANAERQAGGNPFAQLRAAK